MRPFSGRPHFFWNRIQCGLLSLSDVYKRQVLDYVVIYFPTYTGNTLLASLFGGVCMGAGLAVVFMRGSTTGGSDILGKLLQLKAPHIPIGRMMPVSYTHLDVYKRQVQNQIILICQSRRFISAGFLRGKNRSKFYKLFSFCPGKAVEERGSICYNKFIRYTRNMEPVSYTHLSSKTAQTKIW